jgi:hypothetical protein
MKALHKVFEISTTELIKNLVVPEHKPYVYDTWLLERWKDEGVERVILCRTPADVRLCWSRGIPAVGIPIAVPLEKSWLNFLISYPELVILEPLWGHDTLAKAVTRALKFAEYAGQVKAVGFPVEAEDPEELNQAEVQCGIGFKDMLDEKIVSASVIDLNSLPSKLKQRAFDEDTNLQSKFASVGIIMRDEDEDDDYFDDYFFKILMSPLED